MHPAYSIIFFTTASGAGYGLLALLGLLAASGVLPAERWFGLTGFAVSLGLVTFGLLSSTFHLGHPERAWRALSQWRSSWLSREGVLAIVTYVPAVLFAFAWIVLGDTAGVWSWLGILAAAGAAATVYCTAMIYRSLAAVPQWDQPLVPLAYLVLGLGTGAVWLNALLALFAMAVPSVAVFAAAACLVAWRVKQHYWRRIDSMQPASTAASATGLGALGTVRLLEPPHTEQNYLQKEMGYRVARKHAVRLRLIASLLAFVVPAILIGLQFMLPVWGMAMLAVPAALSASLGVVIERWLFFAEAQHKVSLYYGAQAV